MVFVPAPDTTVEPPIVTTPDDISAELRVQRRNTREFIAADPLYTSLRYRGSSRTPSGAIVRQGATERPQQRFKLIMQSPAGGSIELAAADGVSRKVDYILLGEWDCVFEVGDYWDDNAGRRYNITAIVAENLYERRAVVQAYGSGLDGG